MKLARVSSLAECAKARALIEAGAAMLAWRRTDAGRELVLKTASGVDQAVIAPKFESEFRSYAGRWGKQ